VTTSAAPRRQPDLGPTPVVPRTRRPLAALALLILVAWGAHWHTFPRLELGLDGAFSVDLARSPLGELLALSAHDVHPPLFYVLLKGWLWLAGAHYLTAKYLAIAASLPALPLLYQLGRRVLPDWFAVFAVIILAVAPATLFLAPTVRDFSLGLTLSLATVVLTLDLSGKPSPTTGTRMLRLAGLAVLSAAALLTWYFHLFLLPVEALVLLYARRRVVAAHGALAAGCLAALPWYGYVWPHVTGKLAHGTTTFGGAPHLPNGREFADGLARALFGLPVSTGAVAGDVGWLLALLLGTLITAKVIKGGAASTTGRSSGRPVRHATCLLNAALVLGVIEVGVTTLRWSDIGSLSRYVLPLLPYTSLLQARALTACRFWWRAGAAAGLGVAVAMQLFWFVTLVSSPPIDWSHDQALAYVATHAEPGDALLFNDRARRGRYLLDGGVLPAAVIHTAGQAYLADSLAQGNDTATGLARSAARIWLVENAPSVDVAQRALATHAFGLPPSMIDGSVVQLFLARSTAPVRPNGAVLGGAFALDSSRIPLSVKPGGLIPMELDWRDIRPLDVPYTVFVHVKASPDKTVAQHDSPPDLGFSPTTTWQPGQRVSDRFALELPTTVPPGDYAIHVGLYNGATRLTEPDGTNAINVGTLHVGA